MLEIIMNNGDTFYYDVSEKFDLKNENDFLKLMNIISEKKYIYRKRDDHFQLIYVQNISSIKTI